VPNNEMIQSFYINTNGLISFDHQLSYSGEITSPQNVTRFVAPLWTDIDTRNIGEIFHKKITDKSVLNSLKEEINKTDFNPSWAYEY
jgi:hypothetical protein